VAHLLHELPIRSAERNADASALTYAGTTWSYGELAGQIERLLLDETPVIWAYFYNYLTASQKNVTGVYPTAQGQYFLWNAAKA